MRSRRGQFNLGDIAPGMTIGQSIVSTDGRIILSEGTTLTHRLIDRLRMWNVDHIIIGDAEPEKEPLKPLSAVERKFQNDYQFVMSSIRKIFENIRINTNDTNNYSPSFTMADVEGVAARISEILVQCPNSLLYMHLLKRCDDYTLHHSINVSIIAGTIGHWCDMRDNEINLLVLAGLLHDIGKSQIPFTILNKPASLTVQEMEAMRLHTTYGYYILKSIKNMPHPVMITALQHHERANGSGYPLKVDLAKIHPFAKIVAVADIYDAVTSDRAYRKQISPFSALEILINEMFVHLDPEKCKVFIRNILNKFQGAKVRLSNNEIAEVLHIGCFMSAKPVVKTTNNKTLDLAECNDIDIVEIIEFQQDSN